MLVDVFDGRDHNNATPTGCFHFARSPTPGEQVEINGKIQIVSRAWHQPGRCYAGAKFAILISEQVTQVDEAEPSTPDYDMAGQVV